jgi:hypothetical protein
VVVKVLDRNGHDWCLVAVYFIDFIEVKGYGSRERDLGVCINIVCREIKDS